jgi:2-keto-3-deoxy-L-fuconate dehydrogenase
LLRRFAPRNDENAVIQFESLFKEKKMSDRLKGKRAFVTAGAAGIGRATAIAFAREGATVFATDIDEKGLATLAGEGVSEVARLDVRDTAAVNAMAKRVGPVDILFNAAGFVHHGTVLDCSDEDWDFSFDLNVKSMHRTLRAFLPGMLEKGGGSIVNISSAAGVFKAAPNRYVYGATKAAVAALTRAVAVDFITRGIRCNCICPGTIETPSMLGRAAAAGPQGREMFVSRQPMGRLGTADEIAALAVYLASDESAFTTGVAHIIDGGWTL